MSKADEVIAELPEVPDEVLTKALDFFWRVCRGGAKPAMALSLRIASSLAIRAYEYGGEVFTREEWDRLCAAAYEHPAPIWGPPSGDKPLA